MYITLVNTFLGFGREWL